MRRAVLTLTLLLVANVLGGCVISLFSDNEVISEDEQRLQKLEKRMDRIEGKSSEFGY